MKDYDKLPSAGKIKIIGTFEPGSYGKEDEEGNYSDDLDTDCCFCGKITPNGVNFTFTDYPSWVRMCPGCIKIIHSIWNEKREKAYGAFLDDYFDEEEDKVEAFKKIYSTSGDAYKIFDELEQSSIDLSFDGNDYKCFSSDDWDAFKEEITDLIWYKNVFLLLERNEK